MCTELVSQHAFHLDGSNTADRDVIYYRRHKINADPAPPGAPATNGWKQLTEADDHETERAECHAHLAPLCRVVQRRNKPAVALRFKNREIIGLDGPTGFLSQQVEIPPAPAHLAVEEKAHRPEACDARQNGGASVLRDPVPPIAKSLRPTFEERPDERKNGTWQTDDSRGRHCDSVDCREDLRPSPLSSCPIDEAQQRH